MAPSLLPLPRTEAHLWLVETERARDPHLVAAYLDLLTDEERARHARHQIERARHEFLVTRALVRTVLSRYAAIEPTAWRFRANAHGRPEIDLEGAPPLSFNLSNTQGLVACLVAEGREVGVDVENIDRHGEQIGIADRFFSATEVAALHALPAEAQRQRFFTYWTLKEAYIKARGMGLALPLGQFSLLLDPGEPVRIAFDPRLADDPATWQLLTARPTERHLLAAAIRRKDEPDLTVVTRHVVPLVKS